MKRIEQLQNLSREHHQSLTLAQKAIKTSESHNDVIISELCKEIVADYPDVWKIHFSIEEDSIFQLFSNSSSERHSEIANLCHSLIQEHQTMNGYYEQMKRGNFSVLGEFGSLLKTHTRKEERQLFPLLEEVMTPEELNRVLQVSQEYRKTD